MALAAAMPRGFLEKFARKQAAQPGWERVVRRREALWRGVRANSAGTFAPGGERESVHLTSPDLDERPAEPAQDAKTINAQTGARSLSRPGARHSNIWRGRVRSRRGNHLLRVAGRSGSVFHAEMFGRRGPCKTRNPGGDGKLSRERTQRGGAATQEHPAS